MMILPVISDSLSHQQSSDSVPPSTMVEIGITHFRLYITFRILAPYKLIHLI